MVKLHQEFQHCKAFCLASFSAISLNSYQTGKPDFMRKFYVWFEEEIQEATITIWETEKKSIKHFEVELATCKIESDGLSCKQLWAVYYQLNCSFIVSTTSNQEL